MAERTPAYGAGLASTLRSTAAAYGYTLTTATTLAMLAGTHGSPGTGDLFLFVGGGLIGYLLLEALLWMIAARGKVGDTLPIAGALNVFSVTAGLGGATAVAHEVGSGIAWLLAPLASTALYLLVVAAQVAAVARLSR
jgi:hypothetical protein